MIWVSVGALLGMIGVILGAYGSHGLEGVLSADQLNSYQVAVRYQLLHSLLIVMLGFTGQQQSVSLWIPVLFLVGILLFSGSIYLLLLGPGWNFLGPVTPIGGVFLIGGWLALFIWSMWNY